MSAPPRPSGGLPLGGLAVLAALAVLAVAAVTAAAPRTPAAQLFGDLSLLTAALLAGLGCLRAARRKGPAARSWALLSAAAFVWASGMVVWTWYGVTRDHVYPFPSLADLGFVGYSIPAVAGLLLFPRTLQRQFSGLRLLLDALVVAAALLFVSWATVLRPLLEAGGSGAGLLVSLAYPLADVVIASLVLILGMQVGGAARRPWLLLGSGLLLLTVTDSIYVSMQVAGQSGITGTPLAVGWVGAFLLVAFAALVPPARETRRRRQFSLVQEVLPVVPVVAAAVVAAQTRFRDDAQILLVLGVVLLVLVAAQQVVRALEMVRLANGMETTIQLRTTALRAAEDRFGSLIESSDEAIVGKTVDGVVTSWNPAAERLYGYRAEEIVGRSVMLIVPEDRHEEERAILASAVDRTQRARYETERRRKDGTVLTVALTVSPILDGDRVVGVSAISQDVTDRKRQERALRVQQQRTRAIIDTATDTFVAMDESGLITEWNRAAELAFGWTREEAVGKVLSETIVPQRYRQAHEHGRERVLSGGEPHVLGTRVEIEAVHRDGSELQVELSAWRAEGEGGGFNAFLRDITDRKRAEQELAAARDQAVEASRAKSEFLATMSHEIRTPMNGVIGLTGLLLDTPLDDVQRRYVTGVRGAGEALLGIIDDILDFSKLEAGKVDLEPAPFDPRQLVEEVGVLLASGAAAKRLELVASCAPDVPTALVGDAGRLRQVLINLTSNAIKFTSSGDVVLRAEYVLSDGELPVLELSVSDTGIGIDPTGLQRLFEPFAQADASITRRFGGTGLGLAICRRLVMAMAGELTVDSEPGVGSTFRVRVPLPSCPAPEAQVRPDGLHGLRVLVVDDNATNRLVLAEQLAGLQLAADLADGAAPAWGLLQAAADQGRPYDIAVLDLCMPDVDGLTLAGWIAAEPRMAGTRTLLLTSAGTMHGDRLAAARVQACLSKPVRSSELYDALLLTTGRGPAELEGTPLPAARTRGASVLVVEDNQVNQIVATGLLERLGYQVDLAEDGRGALAALANRPYAAVLMDCHMPEMDGYTTTIELRRREGTGRRTPVIAMTAGVLAEDRDRCRAAGMDDFVSKPVDAALLGRTMARWVSADSPQPPAQAPPVTPEDPEVLDGARLEMLRTLGADDGWGMLPAVVEAFLRAAPDHAAALRTAHAAADAEALEAVLHRLRGSAANLGATRLAGTCADLSDRLRAAGVLDAAAVAALDAELAAACDALADRLPTRA